MPTANPIITIPRARLTINLSELSEETIITAIRLADEFARCEIETCCDTVGLRAYRLDSIGQEHWHHDLQADAAYLVARGLATRDGDVITFPPSDPES